MPCAAGRQDCPEPGPDTMPAMDACPDIPATTAWLADLARRVGGEVLARADELRRATSKGGVDLVTEADGLSERLLVEALAERFPDHAIAGEEGSRRGPPGARYTWHVDPIDGTCNFSRGLPYWALSIGLADGHQPLLGCIHLPAFASTLTGGRGHGGTLDGVRLPPLTAPGAESTWVIATDWPWKLSERSRTNAMLVRLMTRIRQFKTYGSAAVDLLHVAAGKVDAYAIPGIFPWDQCAGAAVIAALGGELRTWDGSAWDLRHPDIIACRPGMGSVLAAATG